MVTDLKQLIDLCNSELVDRGYGGGRQQELVQGWEQLFHWMGEQGFLEFSEEIGFKYCDETFGGHLLRDDMAQSCRIGLRAVRMLISYQKTGDFEFRSPKVERCFSGANGKPFIIYLSYARNVMRLATATLSNKEFYLHAFYAYLEGRSLTLEDLGVAIIEEFYTAMGYTLASRHNCGSTLRIFLRYAFDNGMTNKDWSIYFPLLASVGNAIIDYMKNGRPDTGSDTVVVSAESGKKGKPLSRSTVHSVVTRYMRKADIADWNKKKHGAHSLRHSLASNMLKMNVSIQTMPNQLFLRTVGSAKLIDDSQNKIDKIRILS